MTLKIKEGVAEGFIPMNARTIIGVRPEPIKEQRKS
jgi:hypothetical protein